jgi:sRNA-binding carbon storage regulator CsrA
VLEVSQGKVRLGFEVDKEVPVHRSEVWERSRAGGPPDSATQAPARRSPSGNGQDPGPGKAS